MRIDYDPKQDNTTAIATKLHAAIHRSLTAKRPTQDCESPLGNFEWLLRGLVCLNRESKIFDPIEMSYRQMLNESVTGFGQFAGSLLDHVQATESPEWPPCQPSPLSLLRGARLSPHLWVSCAGTPTSRYVSFLHPIFSYSGIADSTPVSRPRVPPSKPQASNQVAEK